MPGPVDMPLIISQLANVQKISNSEVTKSGLQQTLMINPEEQDKNKKPSRKSRRPKETKLPSPSKMRTATRADSSTPDAKERKKKSLKMKRSPRSLHGPAISSM